MGILLDLGKARKRAMAAEDGLVNESSAGTSKGSTKGDSASKAKDRLYLESLLNKTFKVKISDGRTLVGTFLCTDKEQNVILGQCLEYVEENGLENEEEARTLGLAMVPGRHIISIELDTNIPMFRTMEHSVGKVNFAAKDI